MFIRPVIGAGGNLLEANFNAANGTSVAAYTPEIGTYFGDLNNGAGFTQIYNNALAKSAVASGSQFAVVWTPTDTVTTIEADIETYVTNNQGMQGLFVRVNNDKEGYTCHLYNQNADINKATLLTPRTNLASVPFAFTDDTLYHYKVVLTGNQIDFYIDDALIVTATDATYTGPHVGYAGWYTQNATANQRFMDTLIAY